MENSCCEKCDCGILNNRACTYPSCECHIKECEALKILGYAAKCPMCGRIPATCKCHTTQEEWEKLLDGNHYEKTGLYLVSGGEWNVNELKLISFIRTLLAKQREELRGKISGMKRIRKPTHGTCCTCQTCGGDIDNCDCERNRVLDEVLDILK